MNFFLDENFPLGARSLIEARGGIVFDIRGTKHEGAGDVEIFRMAQEKSALFLTTDKDFFHTITPLYLTHFGAIVIALSQPNSNAILEKLVWSLEYIEKNDVRSKCLLLTDTRLYIIPK